MSRQVLHLDFIKLNPEAGPEQLGDLQAAAARLKDIEGVQSVGVLQGEGDSDFDLAFWFQLREFTDLEPFGTDPRYSRFLQGSVAPVLRAFAGADLQLEEDYAAADGPATCLALTGPEAAYDFEVREALEAWCAATTAPTCMIGIAIGERLAYRGAAIAFGAQTPAEPDTSTFRATVIAGRATTL